MKHFEIKVNARSKEELEKRVKDNESRGFEVVRYYEKPTEVTFQTGSKYKDSSGTYRRQRSGALFQNYGAVMRRKSRKEGAK